jgi:hypothetical protein
MTSLDAGRGRPTRSWWWLQARGGLEMGSKIIPTRPLVRHMIRRGKMRRRNREETRQLRQLPSTGSISASQYRSTPLAMTIMEVVGKSSPSWPAARLNSNCQSRESPGRHMPHYSGKSTGENVKSSKTTHHPARACFLTRSSKTCFSLPISHPPASSDGLMSKTLNPHHHHHLHRHHAIPTR